MTRSGKIDLNIAVIRILAAALLALTIVITTVQYGFSNSLDPEAVRFWDAFYLLFEHIFRAITIFLGSLLTYRFARKSTGRIPLQRRINLIGLSIASLLLLVVWPLASGYWELYYVLMPFPWSTIPFQLSVTGTLSGKKLPGWMGIDAVTLLLWAYTAYQVIVFAGTVILGRKWHCSMLCLMNGCHAESLGIGLPIVTHDKKRPRSKRIRPGLRRAFIIAQRALFAVNLVLVFFWTVYLATGSPPIPESILFRIETIKYVGLELGLMMFLWFLVGGRGYCYYCPAGFGLALVSRLAGQRVETGLTRCTQCRACNDACPMSIDIMAMAKRGKPVLDLSCVCCGLCEDACPTMNLRYRTHLFQGLVRSRL